MKLVKQIYIASPYTHKSKTIQKKRKLEIDKIAAKLHVKYPYAFILPITTSARLVELQPSLGGTFANWGDRDLSFIFRSDEVWVVMMQGWKESIGVQEEIRFAQMWQIPRKYINPKTLRFIKYEKTK